MADDLKQENAPQRQAGSQAEYARHIGVSREAVRKMVSKGKIPVRPDGKIDFAAADAARSANADPSRTSSIFAAPAVAEAIPAAPAQALPERDTTFNEARTERETYQAKLARLEYEKAIDLYLPRREVEEAIVTGGRTIRLALDVIPGMADEIVAVIASGGGVHEVRQIMRGRVIALEKTIAASLMAMATVGDDDGPDTDGASDDDS